jgi:hypothetical protein
MPDIYGVTPADVAAEMPELFPEGFTASTRPASAQVAQWVSVADTVVYLRVFAVTGETPAPSDTAAKIAKQYIIEWTKAKVYEAIYAGRADEEVRRVTDPYFDAAATLLEAIADLGEQATGTGETLPLPFDPSAWTAVRSLRAPVKPGTVAP